MFQIPSLALRINPRVWEWAVQRVERAAHSRLPTRYQNFFFLKKKNAFADTAPENHLALVRAL